jgi:hypothetical protein
MDDFDANRYESKQYLKTFVRYEERCFFVSSINRLFLCDNSYYEGSETMAWECDPISEKKILGANYIFEAGGAVNYIGNHFSCVDSLLRTGSVSTENCDWILKNHETI